MRCSPGWPPLAAMQIQNVVTSLRSPWQNAYVERFIGSIRRECLDHMIVLNAAGLQRLVAAYVAYYMRSRTHLGLDKDAPMPRPDAGGHRARHCGSTGPRVAPSLRACGRLVRDSPSSLPAHRPARHGEGTLNVRGRRASPAARWSLGRRDEFDRDLRFS
jgi:hypothetical protein